LLAQDKKKEPSKRLSKLTGRRQTEGGTALQSRGLDEPMVTGN
jgi:hypothetical protein